MNLKTEILLACNEEMELMKRKMDTLEEENARQDATIKRLQNIIFMCSESVDLKSLRSANFEDKDLIGK